MRFSLVGDLRFLSHLDLARLFERSIRCAGLPLRFSTGYNPRPSVQLPLPHPVGVAGQSEPLVLELTNELHPSVVAAAINAQLPAGAVVLAAESLGVGERVWPEWAEYACVLPSDSAAPGPTACGTLRERLRSGEPILTSRGGRDRHHPSRQVNIAPHVMDFSVSPVGTNVSNESAERGGLATAELSATPNASAVVVRVRVRVTPSGTARPEEVLAALGVPRDQTLRAYITRTRVQLSRVRPGQSRWLPEVALAEPHESVVDPPGPQPKFAAGLTDRDLEPFGQSGLAVSGQKC